MRDWFEEELANPYGLRPHFPVEIRFSAADDVWLSPSSGNRTCWIGIIQYKFVIFKWFATMCLLILTRPYGFKVPYRKLFERFEQIVLRHGGRPHWAKAHRMRPDNLRSLYPRFDDFVQVLEDIDPQGLFRNEYIARHIFGSKVDDRVF
jgi:L-gulonolactone oxidase